MTRVLGYMYAAREFTRNLKELEEVRLPSSES